MEEQTNESEVQNELNGEQSPNNGEKTTFTLEEVEEIKRKMQSDSERGVQKLINENKVYKSTFDYLGQVADDPKYLVELNREQPEVAKVILEKYYNGQTIEEYKDSIEYEEDYKDPKVIKEMITKEAKKLAEKETLNLKKDNFIKKLNLTGDELEKFEEAFSERMELRSFKVSNVETHLEKAYREIADINQLDNSKNNGIIGEAMARTSGSIGSKTKDTKKEALNKEINSFMRDHNLI